MTQSQTTNKIFVTAIKAFTDNYIWAITSSSSEDIALVDPGDAQVCIEYLEKNNKNLSTILITHHHSDHTGGINELLNYCHNKGVQLTIYGPKGEIIPQVTNKVCAENQAEIANLGITFSIIDLPGHTKGHIAYYYDDILFCGDTLFSGGCGRIFEGTAAQMYNSLTKLKKLPKRTQVYCTHEYTLANLEFALTVDPENLEVIQYYNQVTKLRDNNQITLPSSMLRENQINPFLRCHDENIKQSVTEHTGTIMTDELMTFTKLRQWKDNF